MPGFLGTTRVFVAQWTVLARPIRSISIVIISSFTADLLLVLSQQTNYIGYRLHHVMYIYVDREKAREGVVRLSLL